MTARVLVTGTLFRGPEQRTFKAGKPFVMATLIAKDGEVSQFWLVLAFTESVRADLARLKEGEAIAVQGALQAETYTRESGETKLSLSVVADRVLGLRAEKRKKAAGRTEDDRTVDRRLSRRAGPRHPSEGPNDAIPF
jgi:single-stranded DNA-binding protein